MIKKAFPELVVLFLGGGGLCHEDCGILGSVLGSPYVGKFETQTP